MSFPASLPSPARGVPAARTLGLQRFRRFLLRTVSAEASDGPARFAVGATVAPVAVSILGTVLGYDSVATFVTLIHLPLLPLFPLLLISQMAGFMSRASTARFIAGVATTFLVGGIVLGTLGDFSSLFFTVGPWVYRGLLAGAVGVWAARAVRRLLVDGAPELPGRPGLNPHCGTPTLPL